MRYLDIKESAKYLDDMTVAALYEKIKRGEIVADFDETVNRRRCRMFLIETLNENLKLIRSRSGKSLKLDVVIRLSKNGVTRSDMAKKLKVGMHAINKFCKENKIQSRNKNATVKQDVFNKMFFQYKKEA